MSDFGEIGSSVEHQKAASLWETKQQARTEGIIKSDQRQAAFQRDTQRTAEGISEVKRGAVDLMYTGVDLAKKVVASK
jgi:hypothetical protein